MKTESKKLFHLHLQDSMGNKQTLICRLKDGSINYILYGGTGSSGMPFALSNIQFYKLENGNMCWMRDARLPVENLEGETLEQFKDRVIDMLNHSTEKVIREVNTNVKFA
jgi:hypothetical protein